MDEKVNEFTNNSMKPPRKKKNSPIFMKTFEIKNLCARAPKPNLFFILHVNDEKFIRN